MKKRKLIIVYLLTLVFSTGEAFAQENIHYLHSKTYNEKNTTDIKSKSKTIELQARSNELSHIVFGFLPYWLRTYNDSIQYDLLSHVAIYNFNLEGNVGQILGTPGGWPWVDVINSAHSAGTKVIINITDNNFSTTGLNQLLYNDVLKNNLFNEIKTLLSDNDLDGVIFDLTNSLATSNDDDFMQLLEDLRTFLNQDLPDIELSFMGPSVNWLGLDIDGIASKVDYVYIQAYGYSWSGSSNAGPTAPLYAPLGERSIDWTYNDYMTWVTNDPLKLILGVPYYGRKWRTIDDAPNSEVLAHIGSKLYSDAITEMGAYGRNWDDISKTPWYGWFDTDWYQVWTEDTESLGAKYDYAINKGLGGIGIWALNYDLGRKELWELIDNKFSTVTTNIRSLKGSSISVYPNPANDYITINCFDEIPAKIQISDIAGNVVAIINPESNSFKIDISHLSRGIYFIYVNGMDSQAYKIIKE